MQYFDTVQKPYGATLSPYLFKKLRRYHTMQTDSKLAESKLKSAEGAQQKLQAPRKRASVKRAKNADKLREKVSVKAHDSTVVFEALFH